METYPIDESLQELPELSAAGANDLLLVSEREVENDQVRYFSKKLKYSTLSVGLYAQFDLDNLTAAVKRNKDDIAVLSGDISVLSGDLYRLSVAFLSNDFLTQLIPSISVQVIEISNSLSDAQPIDRLVDLSIGQGTGVQLFKLNNYAINICHAVQPVIKFVMPEQDYNGRLDLSDGLSNITRHLLIDLSADVNVIPRFTNNCRYISDFDLTSTISAGQHVVFTMKEVEKDLMYVTRRNVLCVGSGTNENEVVVALVYRKAIDDQIYTDVIPDASADTRLSDYPDYCYELSDITPPSRYFSHWLDTRYPDKYLLHKDFPGYYISADMVLCAVYSDNAPIMVYFYGATMSSDYDEETDTYSYVNRLVKDCSPQYFGNNMFADVPREGSIVEGTHIPYGTEPIQPIVWAEGSPAGRMRLASDWSAWALSAPELSSGYAELNYYVVYKNKNEHTDELSVDEGIESIEPDATVLELDYNYDLDTDWDDAVNFRGVTESDDLAADTQVFPVAIDYYNIDGGPYPVQNDVVRRRKDNKDFIWVGSDYNPAALNESGFWSPYDGASFEWYGAEPLSSDRYAVLLRLDRLAGDNPINDKNYGYLISAEMLNVDTYVYIPPNEG